MPATSPLAAAAAAPALAFLWLVVFPVVYATYLARLGFFSRSTPASRAAAERGASRMLADDRASFTAELVAWLRAVATWRGECDDPVAWLLLSWEARVTAAIAYATWRFAPASVAARLDRMIAPLVARTGTIDEAVLAGKPAQVVILGAGLDARAHRLRGLDETRWFEVDAPATQRAKRALVEAATRASPATFAGSAARDGRLAYVHVDFSSESFLDKLVEAGFSPAEPRTVFVMEGVTTYLPWEASAETLRGVSARCAKGTRFVVTFFVTAKGGRNTSFFGAFVKRMGEEHKFSIAPDADLAGMLAPLGFRVTDVRAMGKLPQPHNVIVVMEVV